MGATEGMTRKSVLVVEDEPSLRLLCRVNLELEGHRVSEAATLAEAREAIEREQPDVILLDLHLGSDDGLDLLDELDSLDLPLRVMLLSGRARSAPSFAPGSPACSGSRSISPPQRRRRRARLSGSSSMSVATVRTPAEYEERLSRYLFERVRGGARGPGRREGDLRAGRDRRALPRSLLAGQLDVLREAEESADGDDRELLYRLRKTCEAGLVAAELAAREDELENRILAARVPWQGEELPLRTAQAKLAVLPEYRDRDELGALANAESARFNDDRRELLAAGEALEAELTGEPDAIARNAEEKGISLHELERALDAREPRLDRGVRGLRERWFEKLLGPERDDIPTSSHTSYLRRLSPLEATYTKERAVPVCVATLAELGFDLEQMPGHPARPRRPAAEVAARLRDRVGPARTSST